MILSLNMQAMNLPSYSVFVPVSMFEILMYEYLMKYEMNFIKSVATSNVYVLISCSQ
jgi:hypothetical protein